MPEEEKKDEVLSGDGAEAPGEGAAEEEVVVEEVFDMAEDEHYPTEHVEKPFVDSALSKRSMKFYDCFG